MNCTRLASWTLATSTVLLAAACSQPVMRADARPEADTLRVDVRSDALTEIAADIVSSDIVTVDATDVVAPDASTDVLPADTIADDAAIDAAASDALADTFTDVAAMDATDSAGDSALATDVPLVDAGPWTLIPDAGCGARERAVPLQTATHVDVDAAIDWFTNPPSSGPHYGIWAHWGAWPDLPRGYWVHNLEHGGVTYLFQCPSGTCTPVRDSLISVMNSIPMDPTCMPDDAAPARVRVVITNDNAIDTPIAAAAWGWLYAAECVDAPSLRRFYADHAGNAPENFCFDGYYP